jgi:hypothetical protein
MCNKKNRGVMHLFFFSGQNYLEAAKVRSFSVQSAANPFQACTNTNFTSSIMLERNIIVQNVA